MDKKVILIVDDNIAICGLIETLFTREGAQVISAYDGEAGLRAFYKYQPDLVFLDVMMPKINGWEAAQQIHQLSNVPIIMLTALSRTDDIVRGFNAGAIHYITKPFNLDTLVAQSRAVLRWTMAMVPENTSPSYSDDYLVIDLEKRKMQVAGQMITLSSQDFNLLSLLLENADHVVTNEEILSRMREEGEVHQNKGYVRSRIWLLRQKIERDPGRPIYIHIERGIGYRFKKNKQFV